MVAYQVPSRIPIRENSHHLLPYPLAGRTFPDAEMQHLGSGLF